MLFLTPTPSNTILHLPEDNDLPNWPLFSCAIWLFLETGAKSSDRWPFGNIDQLHFWVHYVLGWGFYGKFGSNNTISADSEDARNDLKKNNNMDY